MNHNQLLAHADFVRSLARSLVVDENSAADLEQRAWLAALEHPPATDRNVRSWFAKVVHNFVVTMYRGESRRRKYEEAAPVLEAQAKPDEIAQRKEALRTMTEAVLDLEEPYLSAILLRFYEDLPPRIVAERLGVPVETVKTRIQRGLVQLRSRLDDRYGGNRMNWCIVLAPLAGLKLMPSAAAAAVAATASTGTSAGSTVAAPGSLLALKLGLAAAVIFGTTFVLYTALRDSHPEHSAPSHEAVPAEAQGSGEADALRLMNLPTEEDRTELPVLPADQAAREWLTPNTRIVAGRVTDRETGEPIPLFDFYLESVENYRIVSVIHETVRDEDGRFSFPLGSGKYGQIAIWANHYTRKRTKWFPLSGGEDLADFRIELDPGLEVFGRVLDAETDRPVAGAIVGPAVYPWETDLVSLALMNYEAGGIRAVTDVEGRFSIKGLRRIDERVAAVHPDYAEGYETIRPGSGREVMIRLEGGYQLHGKVLDDQGRPLPDVLIRIYGNAIPTCRPVLTGPEGYYRTPPVRPGRVFVKAGDPPREMKNHPDFTPEFEIIDVVDQDVEVNFGPSADHLTWRGTLYGHEGLPEARGCLLIRPALLTHDEAYWYKFRRFVHCDDEGRFAVDKMHPGRYRVDLQLFGASRPDWFHWGIETFDAAGSVERDLDLHRGSTLSGVVVDSVKGQPLTGTPGQVWAHKGAGGRRPYSADLDGEGRFLLRGLSPGSYEVSAFVDGYHAQTVLGWKVESGTMNTDLRIVASPRGRLNLRASGFDGTEEPMLNPLLLCRDSGQRIKDRELRIGKDGTLVKAYDLTAGGWLASLCFEKLGYIEREFEIFPGRETELTVHRNEVLSREGAIALSGRVVSPGGAPVAGLDLIFKAENVPGLSGRGRVQEGSTDDEGGFLIEGFEPGRWEAIARITGGGELSFPDLWIPADAPDPFFCPLVLEGGLVSGSLIDRLSGRPIDAEQSREWSVKLQDVREHRFISSQEGGVNGNQFELKGLSSGRYQLQVQADGYEDYFSGAFPLEEGQALHLGGLLLEPCGILDLAVMDEALKPLKFVWIVCDGRRRFSRDLVQGKRRYDKLPLGLVTITVGARGFLEKSIRIMLEPGRAVETNVLLHAKP